DQEKSGEEKNSNTQNKKPPTQEKKENGEGEKSKKESEYAKKGRVMAEQHKDVSREKLLEYFDKLLKEGENLEGKALENFRKFTKAFFNAMKAEGRKTLSAYRHLPEWLQAHEERDELEKEQNEEVIR